MRKSRSKPTTKDVPKLISNKKCPFSEAENTKLLEMFRDNRDTLLSKFRSNLRNSDKRRVWLSITEAVNAVGHKNRSVNEVQHRWKDLKYDARKTLSQRKNPQTGGGKKPKECPFTDLVLDIIGANAPSLVGVAEGRILIIHFQRCCFTYFRQYRI